MKDTKGLERRNDEMSKILRYCGLNKEILFTSQQEKQKRHMLVVEDEEKIAPLLCDYLKEAGFRTSSQGNGNRVISQVKKDSPDLILLDIMLPRKDGDDIPNFKDLIPDGC